MLKRATHFLVACHRLLCRRLCLCNDQGEDVPGACGLERACRFGKRRAGGRNIIDKDDVFVFDARRVGDGESVLDARKAFPMRLRLRLCIVIDQLDQRFVVGKVHSVCERPCDKCRLVESALAFLCIVQGDGHDDRVCIEYMWLRPEVFCVFGQEACKRGGRGMYSFIFIRMDAPLYDRIGIVRGRSNDIWEAHKVAFAMSAYALVVCQATGADRAEQCRIFLDQRVAVGAERLGRIVHVCVTADADRREQDIKYDGSDAMQHRSTHSSLLVQSIV